MKRLLFLCLLMVIGFSTIAQEIQVKRVKKIQVSHKSYDPSFGENSHQILLFGQDRVSVSLYNTITRREKPGPYPLINMRTGGTREIEARVKGKAIELIVPGSDTLLISPAGDYFYIWVTVSPDNQQLLFTAAGKGTYVSDLAGNVTADLGYLNDPTWISDIRVLGMQDEDDGQQVTSSDIWSIHLPSGRKENLTLHTEEIALRPRISNAADRIVFHNSKGEVFTMRIKIRD